MNQATVPAAEIYEVLDCVLADELQEDDISYL